MIRDKSNKKTELKIIKKYSLFLTLSSAPYLSSQDIYASFIAVYPLFELALLVENIKLAFRSHVTSTSVNW